MRAGGEMEKEQSKEIKVRWTRSRKVSICGPCSLLQTYPPKGKEPLQLRAASQEGTQHKEPGYSPADDSLKGHSYSTSK